ncbi:endolytic transglycosylase MltG [Persephonella sp.]
MANFFKALSVFLTVFLGLVILYGLYIKIPVNIQKEKIIKIERGKSIEEIANILKREGVIPDKNIFYIYARLKNKTLKAGYYRFKGKYSVKDVWEILYRGKEQIFPFTIIPGEDLIDVGEKLEKEGFIEREIFYRFVFNKTNVKKFGLEGLSFEGYFPPETYYLSKNSDIEYIVKAFLNVFKKRYFPLKEEFEKRGINFYKGMIIASMVEKESFLDREKPVIAGIILRRLERDMFLQIDPTVIYSLKLKKMWDGKLKKEDMKINSPYNTYLYKGLPPTPISSFSVNTLKSVLNYEKTDYLYYFTPDGKRHVFSKSYIEHLRKIRKFKRENYDRMFQR